MQDNLSAISPAEITPHAALVLVDNALYQAVGQRLSDLESSIFLGSWEGKTYEEIYPSNPEYIEKSVGYKLWKKLSIALGEKVSKKRIRSAVMRHCRDRGGAPGAADDLAKEAKYAVIWQREPILEHQSVIQTLSGCLNGLGYRVHCGAGGGQFSGCESLPPSAFDWPAELQYDAVLVMVITLSDQADQGAATDNSIPYTCD